MELGDLLRSVELVSGSGVGLSPEESAALWTSLQLLRKNMRLGAVLLWGKILGVRGDYYICQACQDEEERLREQRTFYSLNATDWFLLPTPSESAASEARLIRGRFIGDPAHEYEVTARKRAGEGDPAHEEQVTSHIKEEVRLVAAIDMISREAAVVPRGAFIKNPTGQIRVNRCFQGLSVSEAQKLGSFFHFSAAVNPGNRSLLEKADLEPSIDFLASLEHDIPRGCWSIQEEQGGAVVILRSLLWPGMTFYHVPLTPQHGFLYIGSGERNMDLPFMI